MPPPADAVNKALMLFNWTLSQWNRKRYLIYHLKDTSFTATGALNYTVGPAGNFPLDPRPDKLNAAFMRQLGASPGTPVDYPLHLLDTYEDYSRIALKNLQTWSQWVFYDPGWPQGLVYPWPVMQAGFELHLITKAILLRYNDLNAQLGVPDEYEGAFYYIMKVKLGATYRLRSNPVDIGFAKDAMNLIRGANSAISSMKFPGALRSGRGQYNIYSDDN